MSIYPTPHVCSDSPAPFFMTGVSNDYTREASTGDLWGKLGVLLGPTTYGGPGAKQSYHKHLGDYFAWGLDNGCFSNAGEFDESAWLGRLDYLINEVEHAHERCAFAVAPDVFDPVAMKGDPVATIERSLPVLPKIREIGAPAALVFQDGIEDLDLDAIPWDTFDVAFIGGGDDFKLCGPCKRSNVELTYDRNDERLMRFAKLLARCAMEDKPVHVGRVSSMIRMLFCAWIGAGSADGTIIAHAGRDGLRRIRSWFDRLDVEVPRYDWEEICPGLTLSS